MKAVKLLIFICLGISSCGPDLTILDTAYDEDDFETVVIEGKKILEKYPGIMRANHLTGRALTQLNQWEEAIPYLEKSMVYSAPIWMQAYGHAHLGICYYYLDDRRKAKENLELAKSLDTTQDLVDFVDAHLEHYQLTSYFSDWEMIETPNIRFYFQPDYTIKNLRRYCDKRQGAFEKNNVFFEAKLPKKIDYFIWSKPEDDKMLSGSTIGYAYSSICLINCKRDHPLGHEITHVLSEYGNKPIIKNRLIREGVAVAFDLTGHSRIRWARVGNRENLKVKYIMENAEELPFSVVYPVGGALIEYLKEIHGDEALKSLLSNQSWENLIEIYGEDSIVAFENRIKYK